MRFKMIWFVLGLLGVLLFTPGAMAQNRKHSAAWYRSHRRHSAAWYKKHHKPARMHSAAWYRKHRK